MSKMFVFALALLCFAGGARAGEANWPAAVEVPAGTGVYHVSRYGAPVQGAAAVQTSSLASAAPGAEPRQN